MKNNMLGIFATPIYFAMVENVKEIKEEFNQIIKNLHFYDTPEMWGKPHKLTTKNFEDNIIQENNMEVIKKVIDINIRLFLEMLKLPYQEYLLTSWITSYDKGEYAPVHNHLNADISGVYYYETNGKDGDIFFVTPCLVITASMFNKVSENYYVPPEEGKLLLFPGWLQHGVATNTTSSNRKSLAFNIYFRK